MKCISNIELVFEYLFYISWVTTLHSSFVNNFKSVRVSDHISCSLLHLPCTIVLPNNRKIVWSFTMRKKYLIKRCGLYVCRSQNKRILHANQRLDIWTKWIIMIQDIKWEKIEWLLVDYIRIITYSYFLQKTILSQDFIKSLHTVFFAKNYIYPIRLAQHMNYNDPYCSVDSNWFNALQIIYFILFCGFINIKVVSSNVVLLPSS